MAEHIIESKPDSALRILQNIKPQSLNIESNRALYGLLMFQALDKCNKPLQPDSLIEFSFNHYRKINDQECLAICCFYKARVYRLAQRFDDATILYIKSLYLCSTKKDYILLGKIYADMGDISSIQKDFNDALRKYQLSAGCFKRVGRRIDVDYRILEIGRTYRLEKKYKLAHKYYLQALAHNTDSIFCGVVYQEMGANFCYLQQFDSAQYYLRKSLRYPYRNTNYSIRCYFLADLLFDLGQYDSASQYAALSLKHPANYFVQRECYRILVNVEYLRKDIKTMSKYMTQYQCYSDSCRKVESQTKSTVLEKLYNADQEAIGTKWSMGVAIFGLIFILLLFSLVAYFLYQRSKLKKAQLELFKEQLNLKQEFVSQGLTKKIEEAKKLRAATRKNALPEEKAKLDKVLYNSVLHLNDWDTFKQEMNHAFSQIVEKLESEYTGITRKEIIWCCLQLLEVPNTDRMLLLDVTSDSLYKLKQRLAHKMNLKSTKELDAMLKRLATV